MMGQGGTQNVLHKLRAAWARHPVVGHVLLWLALTLVVSISDAVTGTHRRDFTSYSLAAARVLYSGGNPYSREDVNASYKYFPLNATLLGPFTLLPRALAQGAWTATNAILLGWCLWLHRRFWTGGLRVPWWVWGAAMAVALRFFVKNLNLGQWNTSVYCLSFFGLTAIGAGRPVFGAAWVALAAALKYMPSFFLLYAALRRRWRACAAMLVWFVFWVLVLPTLVLGPRRHYELLCEYRGRAAKTYRGMVSPEYTSSQSLRSTIMRMTSEVKPRLGEAPERYDVTLVRLPKEVAKALSEVLAWAVLGATMLVTLRAAPLGSPAETANSGAPPRRTEPQGNTFGASISPVTPLARLRELTLIGLWYVTLLMITPEARTAHFLTLFTPAYALGSVLAARALPRRSARAVAALLGAAIVFLLLPSQLSSRFEYHLYANGAGCYAWALVVLWWGCALVVCRLRRADEALARCR